MALIKKHVYINRPLAYIGAALVIVGEWLVRASLAVKSKPVRI